MRQRVDRALHSRGLQPRWPRPGWNLIWADLRLNQEGDTWRVESSSRPPLNILIGAPVFMAVWTAGAWGILTLATSEPDTPAFLASIRRWLPVFALGFVAFMYIGGVYQQNRVTRKGPVIEIDPRRRELKIRGGEFVPYDRLGRIDVVHCRGGRSSWADVSIGVWTPGGEPVTIPIGQSNGPSHGQIPKVFRRLAEALQIEFVETSQRVGQTATVPVAPDPPAPYPHPAPGPGPRSPRLKGSGNQTGEPNVSASEQNGDESDGSEAP